MDGLGHSRPVGSAPASTAALVEHKTLRRSLSDFRCSAFLRPQVGSLKAETIVTVVEINTTAVPSRVRARSVGAKWELL